MPPTTDTNRRYFLAHSLGFTGFGALKAAPRRKIAIVLVDGFGPEYFERSDMPNLKRMCKEGGFKIGRAVIPTVTNVNNASLVTASFPKEHGITTNFYYDRKSGKSQEMESAEFLLRPTLFEHARRRGLKTAIVTAKDKVRTLCGRGADIEVSAEAPPPAFVAKVGKQESMYSPEANYWTLRAARQVLQDENVDLIYISTTDYMMHTYPPEDERSLKHLHTIDRLLGDLVADHPRLELYLTADHGMNAKHEAIDPARILKRSSIQAEAVPIIRDRHRTHHQNLGGASYVYLERPSDAVKAADILRRVPGIEEVHHARAAAVRFHLHPDRIGDLFLLAARNVAFGNLESEREPARVRSHGSKYEAAVPLIVYGRKADMQSYDYNLDLSRRLQSAVS